MTEEEKQLVLKDLSSRLPYNPHILIKDGETLIADDIVLNGMYINDWMTIPSCQNMTIKPYLRPMSSITEEEKKELLTLLVGEDAIGYFQVESNEITNTDEKIQFGPNWQYHWLNFSNENILLYVDWFNAHHLDYRGLIEKGLALPATENMYK